jgi:hypothetical protein
VKDIPNSVEEEERADDSNDLGTSSGSGTEGRFSMVRTGTSRAAIEGREGEVVSGVESLNVAEGKLTGFVSLFEWDSNLFFGKIV